ncbi:hypothetical protein [Streptomyces flavofungini]|uniref:Sigma-like protein n=1 Tax=Streptomyces flavofungini TaxID=68200 RepID=A0ABS0X0M5_9ACTN|nr:hypothetical protein [Streptomyces flavofungini]MBJ3806725.1 hypothetical protein [Streptomyces flavofungini]GHC60943.1 hypothetical protein GCM10010349_30570 [Streptomyces flavofungini]
MSDTAQPKKAPKGDGHTPAPPVDEPTTLGDGHTPVPPKKDKTVALGDGHTPAPPQRGV